MHLHDATHLTPEVLAQRFHLLTADATEYAIFLVDLVVRWSHTFPHAHRVDKAETLWVVLGILGVVAIIAGGDVGFNMVFKMGARVEAREPSPTEPAPPVVTAAEAAPPASRST